MLLCHHFRESFPNKDLKIRNLCLAMDLGILYMRKYFGIQRLWNFGILFQMNSFLLNNFHLWNYSVRYP